MVCSHSRKKKRICVTTIAPSHPLFTKEKEIDSVDFQSRLNNQVSGRWKKGGQVMKPESPLCVIKCKDGTGFTIYSRVHGTLIEINKSLMDNPSLLVKKPWSDGYIAVILPPLHKSENQKKNLLSLESYQKLERVKRSSTT
ncbi:protein Simiate-like isoform X2 [Limulus polyphemus]|uniref:Protein Abitram n=1 Tax=Limulus polyphemus TaxID=6850 RepID=A0ABM1S9T0_LIMPO|nr:protein Simiate-like isoform X2 [Limulus polyphemus]